MKKSDKKVLQTVFIVFIIILVIYAMYYYYGSNQENFDIVYNQYPNWFGKKPYNIDDWFVPISVGSINAECLPYLRSDKYGSLENLNYTSQAYKFWRM